MCTFSFLNCKFMKKLITSLSIILLTTNIAVANPDSLTVNKEDVKNADAIIVALYDVISGPKDEKRHWNRMRTLFHHQAAMIPTGKRNDTSHVRYISVEDYIRIIGPNLEKSGFFEKEISKKTEIFGDMMHVWSTYESRRNITDEKPCMRGINSIQLWFDGIRWWIINIMWQPETDKNKLPN